MGSLILCHNKRAKHPYEITRIHCKIYTIEELCYYLCNNLYLIDYTIMNEQLCGWLEEELGLMELAGRLRDHLRTGGSVERFVLTILISSQIYGETEMIRIQNVLERLKNQKDIERQKFKGDNLLESGEWEESILVYQSILATDDDSVDEKFFASIYACMGAAYGRLFLYQEAAKMYNKAFQMCHDQTLLKPYIYASYKYMSLEEFHILITKSETLMQMNAVMRKECEDVQAGVLAPNPKDAVNKWKQQYRKSHV